MSFEWQPQANTHMLQTHAAFGASINDGGVLGAAGFGAEASPGEDNFLFHFLQVT